MSGIKFNAEFAERQLILSLIRQPSAIPEVSQIINSEDISGISYKSFYKAFLELNNLQQSENITPYRVFKIMSDLDLPYKNEDIELFYETPPLDHPIDIAKQVRLFSVNRTLLDSTNTVINTMKEANFDTASLISTTKSQLEDLSRKLVDDTTKTFEEEIDDFFSSILSDEVKDEKSIPTPYQTLNKYINGGFKKETLVTVGARPGVGKTVVATQCTAEACSKGASVLYFSLEMSKNQIFKRLVACQGNILLYQLAPGIERTEEVNERIAIAKQEISTWKLEVIDEADVTMEYINAISQQRAQSKAGLDLIIVDYLQLISTKGIRKNNRQEMVAELSRSCKMLARKLNCTVMILVQLNREDKNESEERLPGKEDIRESGAIAADSDEVWILHRKKRDTSPDPKMLLILDKNRHGPADKLIQLRCILEKNILQDTRAEGAITNSDNESTTQQDNETANKSTKTTEDATHKSEWSNPDDLLDNQDDNYEDDFDDLFKEE